MTISADKYIDVYVCLCMYMYIGIVVCNYKTGVCEEFMNGDSSCTCRHGPTGSDGL